MSRIVEVTEPVSVRASQSDGSSYGPGKHEVPDAVAEDLLSHRAVQEPDQSDDDGDSDADQSDGDDADDEVQDWDAADFVDRHHATVRGDVEDGVADGHLDAVKDAEEARDSPRDSVLQAITDRQEQVAG